LQFGFNFLNYRRTDEFGNSAALELQSIQAKSKRTKGVTMKKLMILTILLSSLAFVPTTQAADVTTGATFNTPQVRIQIGQRRHRRNWERRHDWASGDRVGYGRVLTRDVRLGFRTYRETYQVVNGRTVLISRVRLY
jgi:hypothetical protein